MSWGSARSSAIVGLACKRRPLTSNVLYGKWRFALMTSDAQIRANRRNAKRSRGPLSQSGKARSRRNSLKHALSLALVTTGAVEETVTETSKAVVGLTSPHWLLELGRAVALLQLDLTRIRAAKAELMREALSEPLSLKVAADQLDRLRRLDRYEERALARLKKYMNAIAAARPQSYDRVKAARLFARFGLPNHE